MKHPKSLKVVFAALAVSMVPLFGSCSKEDHSYSPHDDPLQAELDIIKSILDIHTFEWQFPEELPEKFEIKFYWVWEEHSDMKEIEGKTLRLHESYDLEEVTRERRAECRDTFEFRGEGMSVFAGKTTRVHLKSKGEGTDQVTFGLWMNPGGVIDRSSDFGLAGVATTSSQLHSASILPPYSGSNSGLSYGSQGFEIQYNDGDWGDNNAVFCRLELEVVEWTEPSRDED